MSDNDMQDGGMFWIEIYHNGPHWRAPIPGKKRYLLERAFLDELVGAWRSPKLSPRPVPDPDGDLYMLDDEQLDAYFAFRKKLREAPPEA